jgi:NADH-quinone oxidoreductase subunit E
VAVDLKAVPKLCCQYVAGDDSLVMLLQEVQGQYDYLPAEVLKAVSRELGVPLARLYGLATFYRSFRLTPRGKHEITVCTGTACHVCGATTMLEHLQRRLQVASGGTTADGRFTLVSVNCLGACAIGPIVVLDGAYHGKMTPDKADALLRTVGKGKEKDRDKKGPRRPAST